MGCRGRRRSVPAIVYSPCWTYILSDPSLDRLLPKGRAFPNQLNAFRNEAALVASCQARKFAALPAKNEVPEAGPPRFIIIKQLFCSRGKDVSQPFGILDDVESADSQSTYPARIRSRMITRQGDAKCLRVVKIEHDRGLAADITADNNCIPSIIRYDVPFVSDHMIQRQLFGILVAGSGSELSLELQSASSPRPSNVCPSKQSTPQIRVLLFQDGIKLSTLHFNYRFVHQGHQPFQGHQPCRSI